MLLLFFAIAAVLTLGMGIEASRARKSTSPGYEGEQEEDDGFGS